MGAAGRAERDSRDFRRWLVRTVRYALIPAWLFNRKVRITRSGAAFVGLVAAVTMAAFNTGNNMLYLVLAMMLGALLVSFMLSEYIIRDIRLDRESPRTVIEGESFRVRYLVENRKALIPSYGLMIGEKLGETPSLAVMPYLRAGGKSVCRGLTLAERRGRLDFHDTVIATRAPFGWFVKEKKVPLSGRLAALPRTDPGQVDRDAMSALGELRPVGKPGQGDELFGFRPYQRGDPVKDIHWKTSARMGELMIRQREAETERRARIVLAVSRTPPPGRDPAREDLVRRAASLCEAMIDDGWTVRVEIAGVGVDYGSSPGHLLAILEFLALFDDPEAPAGEQLKPDDSEPVNVG